MNKLYPGELYYITRNDQLQMAIKDLSVREVIGLDIETANWHLGKELESVSLIQISYVFDKKVIVYVIDCFSTVQVIALKEILENPLILKIAHNASFDTGKLHYHFQIETRNVWCTQKAERGAIGGNPRKGQLKLDTLAWKYFAEKLDKYTQRSDWSRRPLTDRQLKYAAMDAKLMPQLYMEQNNRGYDGVYSPYYALRESIAYQATLGFSSGQVSIEDKIEWLKGFVTARDGKRLKQPFYIPKANGFCGMLVWDVQYLAKQTLESLLAVSKDHNLLEDDDCGCVPERIMTPIEILDSLYDYIHIGRNRDGV